jgi:hypothetical protein
VYITIKWNDKKVKAWVVDRSCPCRSCYHIHNMDWKDSQGNWHDEFRCVRNHYNGCPQPKPEPKHDKGKGYRKYCKVCGSLIKECEQNS